MYLFHICIPSSKKSICFYACPLPVFFSTSNQSDPATIKSWIMSLYCLKLSHLIQVKDKNWTIAYKALPSLFPLPLWCSSSSLSLSSRTSVLEKWKCSSLNHVQLFVTLWAVAGQVPLSMEFSKQEYRSG